MKPMCEKVLPSDNCSWRFVKYSIPNIDFNWHYHPEYEICLTLNSQGIRYVGDNIAPYSQADLVIVGPNLPHTWHSKENSDVSKQIVYVAQIPLKWIHNVIDENIELNALTKMLKLSHRGIEFSHKSAVTAIEIFEKMQKASPLSRYVLLIQLLALMCQDKHTKLLSSNQYNYGSKEGSETDKLDKVIKYIQQHYTNQIYADDLAELAHMSTNHFHRFFKKRTERTLTEFINQLKIGQACKLLISSNSPISVISDQCGFNNISNFNRRFLKMKGHTPSQFRNSIKAPSID
jgi:AraC-like DNA-binding protein